tara:strand:- start:213 stop:425 length:213 start_codon:yes stop_codon:yes gene_type:complete
MVTPELKEAKELLTHIDSDLRHQTLDGRGERLVRRCKEVITKYVELIENSPKIEGEYYITDATGNLRRVS